jgi:ubiquinone/menaquinone biosynthesis C-methylase UbiE
MLPRLRRAEPMEALLEQTFRAEREHFWFRGFRQFIAPLIAEAVRGIDRPQALDCGCGTGTNLTVLERHSNVFGFDITGLGLRYARASGGQRVARASITHIPFRAGAFDLVTSFDVLQCLTEEQETMAVGGMARVLRPGGRLIVNVAALEMLRGRHAALAQEARRYTRPLLRRAMSRAGLEVERMSYTNFSIFPLIAATRTWERVASPSPNGNHASDLATPAVPINAALAGLLFLESKLLRVSNMPIGSSILCMARKPF